MSFLTARCASIAVALILLGTLPVWVGNPYYINVSSQILLFAVFWAFQTEELWDEGLRRPGIDGDQS